MIKLSDRLAGLEESLTLAITAKARAMKAEGRDVIGFGALASLTSTRRRT